METGTLKNALLTHSYQKSELLEGNTHGPRGFPNVLCQNKIAHLRDIDVLFQSIPGEDDLFYQKALKIDKIRR